MQYVYFKNIKISNFLSTGKKPVEISFKPGLNIITGKNYDISDRANAVGKSTIIDALHFVLYGTPIRDLKKENIVNNLAPDSLCSVELEYVVENNSVKDTYRIVRTINPTKCVLFINGEEKTRSSIPETTNIIVKSINTTSEVFQNSVAMTINNTVPFMAQKKVEKRKFIEGILGLEVFGNMLLLARQDYNEYKKNLDIEIVKHEGAVNNYNLLVTQKNNAAEAKKLKKQSLLDRLTNNENDVSICKEKISKLGELKDEYIENIRKELQIYVTTDKELDKRIKDYSDKIQKAKLNIDFYKEKTKKVKKIDNKCPYCGGDLAKEANERMVCEKQNFEQEITNNTKIVEELLPKLEKCNSKKKEIRELLDSNKKAVDDYELNRRERENINNKINNLLVWQNQIKSDLAQIEKEEDNTQSIIDEAKTKVDILKSNITTLQGHLEIIDSVKFITSEEGVKSYIVKKILQVLNTRLLYYLKKLESNSIVKFDEFFEETITNERGIPCSYFNFSGAERKSIDLAMLFAFQDIRRAKSNVWLNVSMFDELLDSSLDTKGIELVLDILRERVENYQESVYIISHRRESMKYCTTGEIVFLEKKNGVTTRATNFTND